MGAWLVAPGTGPLGVLASAFTIGFALSANGVALLMLAAEPGAPAPDTAAVADIASDQVFFQGIPRGWRTGFRGEGDGQFMWPSSGALDSDGLLYLSDEYLHRTSAFDPSREFVSKWGALGSGHGELDSPSGMAFD